MSNIAHLDTSALDTAAKFFRIMLNAGADFTGPMQDTVQRINLVAYLKMGCPKVVEGVVATTWPDGEDLARLILGDDFLSPAEVAKVYGWSYTEDQLAKLSKTLPDLETLMWLRYNGSTLMASPPNKVNLFEYLERDKHVSYYKKNQRFDCNPNLFVSQDIVPACEWLMVRKEPYPNSLYKDRCAQEGLLSTDEYVPSAIQVCYTITTYFRVRGIRLLQNSFVGTSSIYSCDDQRFLFVGRFNEKGVGFEDHSRGYASTNAGIASARK